MIPDRYQFLDALPLTTRGKLDWSALPPATPTAAAPSTRIAPAPGVEQTLATIWSEVLETEVVGADENFFELGGDSILCIQIVSRAAAHGLYLTPKEIFQNQTIAKLALRVRTTPAIPIEEAKNATIPLAASHHWFFQIRFRKPQHFNLATVLGTPKSLHTDLLRDAVSAVVQHHDALQLHFIQQREDRWQACIVPIAGDEAFRCIDLANQSQSSMEEGFQREVRLLQESFDLARAPLLRVGQFRVAGKQQDRLVVVAHHLVVDSIGFGILLDDIELAYRQLDAGQPVSLPDQSTTYSEWLHQQAEYANSHELRSEAEFWRAITNQPNFPLPTDFASDVPNTVGVTEELRFALNREQTTRLLAVTARSPRATVQEVLLTALARAFAPWSGSRSLLVDVEGHGRQELPNGLNVARTIGWFTCVYPLRLELPAVERPPLVELQAIREQFRAVPQGGLGYGLLRHVRSDERLSDELARGPRPEVIWNFLGRLTGQRGSDATWLPRADSIGPTRALRNVRSHLFEIVGSLDQERLELFWLYHAKRHSRETVESLGQRFLQEVNRLVDEIL